MYAVVFKKPNTLHVMLLKQYLLVFIARDILYGIFCCLLRGCGRYWIHLALQRTGALWGDGHGWFSKRTDPTSCCRLQYISKIVVEIENIYHIRSVYILRPYLAIALPIHGNHFGIPPPLPLPEVDQSIPRQFIKGEDLGCGPRALRVIDSLRRTPKEDITQKALSARNAKIDESQ